MIRPYFPTPEEIVIDLETGYALNVSVAEQGYPFWWEDEPQKYAQFNAARVAAGIKIEDFPDGKPEREMVRPIPMGQRFKRGAK